MNGLFLSSKGYEVPWLANFFHSFPHIDLTFQHINSSFNPENTRYRESLLFWGALPVLWLLITLLIFLLYFCYRCCQKEGDKKRRGSCLPWTMAIFAVITCGAIGVGFYGNEDTHKGVLQFALAGEEADDTVHNMHAQLHIPGRNILKQIYDLQDNINNTIDRRLEELKALFRRTRGLNRTLQGELQNLANMAKSYTRDIIKAVDIINRKAEKVDMSYRVRQIREWGYWRWLGTLLLFCWLVLLCLLLLIGIGKHSKCTLLMFCAFGIFSLVLCWVSAGLHFGVSVGMSDFCVQPETYFTKIGSISVDRHIVQYYVKCNTEVKNPFSKSLKSAMDDVTNANSTINTLAIKADHFIDKGELSLYHHQIVGALDRSVQNILQLTALVDCTNIHKDYIDAVKGVCYLALPGVTFILLSCAATGFLVTLLVLLASCAWRQFGARKGYLEIDEDDPFLPRPDNGSPSYYSFPRGRHSNPREHMPMQRRGSPPPAYSTNEFFRQYNDMSSGSLQERPSTVSSDSRA